MKEAIFQSMIERWPSPVVFRTESEKFTGGGISEKYLANLDSQGKGPTGRFRIGRKICYPVTEFVEWLEKRSTPVTGRHPAR